MNENKDAVNFLALYYQDPKFVQWVQKHGFNAITAQTVAKYFSLFKRDVLCDTLECSGCTGFKAAWANEYEIQTGTFKQVPCAIRQQEARQLAAWEVERNFVMPPVFRNTDFNLLTQNNPRLKTRLLEYIASFPLAEHNGLYLYSAVRGLGRSRLLWYITKQLVSEHKIYKGVVAETTGMFAEKLICDSQESGHPFFKQAVACDLLVLDDIGSEHYTPGYTDRLLTILEDRYRNGRPTIVSSLRPLEDYAWESGREPEIFSKLNNMCNAIRVDNTDLEEIL